MSAAGAAIQARRPDAGLLLAAGAVAILVLLAIFGPALAPYSPVRVFATATLAPPSATHPFGGDVNGMDVFSRVLSGARPDIGLALLVAVLAMAIGLPLALVTGYYRGWKVALTLRVLDMVQAFPLLVVALVAVRLLQGGVVPILGTAVLLSVPIMVRVLRPIVMEVRQERFVESAAINGASDARILARHIAPHVLGTALAQSSLTASGTIILVTAMSFVGVGFQPPTAEWGSMVAQGSSYVATGQWWTVVFPGLAITATVLVLNMAGDRLRRELGYGR